MARDVGVAALFVDPQGVYPRLLGTRRCWDERRDARTYRGPAPVVAHPPCHLWVNMAAVNWNRYGRERPAWYPGGSDGRCFEAALNSLCRHGGVLEHPAGSWAFGHLGIAPPVADWIGWQRLMAGQWYVCEVWQSAYGHKATPVDFALELIRLAAWSRGVG